jgi:hypothetical protein
VPQTPVTIRRATPLRNSGLLLRGSTIADLPDGQHFPAARGFRLVQRELMWWVDPTSLDPRGAATIDG